ncbi:ATP-binding cassette domain-containing protein [Rhodobacterales bacterium]|nr:ATP-binding cassette domain-containing protein [Rhodobacterales bacterium]
MLTIENLRTPLVGPISLTLEAGSCTAISGPSGAGKSLFLRAVADLDENSADISLEGANRDRFSAPAWRANVAYVPAESGWWGDRVEDHFQNILGQETRLAALGLTGAADWQVSRLSSGERQRLALLRALEHTPRVLLLDEPTAALDPDSVGRVEDLLKLEMNEGRAVLIVTHDPGQPQRLGGRRFTMAAGKLSPASTDQMVR